MIPACRRGKRLVHYAAMKLMLNLGLAAALVVLTGCGSISSRWRGDRGAAYPGVKLAIESGTHYSTEGEWISFLDVPLSAVVDTFLLPYDLAKEAPAAPSGAPVETVGSPAPAESGAWVGTDRKASNDQLAESRRVLRARLESPVGGN